MRSAAFLLAVVIVAAWAMFGRLAMTTANTANTEAAVNQPIARMQEVRSVSLDGRRLPSARLRALLETHPGAQLDPARLERDRDAMARELASMGYLAARVEPAVVTFDAVGAAYVTFDIDQGKLFRLRSVTVTGPGKDLMVVTLSAGDDAVKTRIDSARQALADGLARRGKPATVELSVHTDLAAAAVDVILATR